MKYRRQRLDLHRFVTLEVPRDRLSSLLRGRIDAALQEGGDLRPVAAQAVAELLERGALRPHGALRESGERVTLYRLDGSSRLFDLRSLAGSALAAQPRPGGPAIPAAAAPPAAATPPPAAPPRQSVAAAPSNSHANTGAWSTVAAIRATFRRDWVSFGLESSLDGLMAELRHQLHEPGLELALWEARLPLSVAAGVGWRQVSEGETLLAAGLATGGPPPAASVGAVTATGVLHNGRRWAPVWAGESVVGALGARSTLDPRLLAEAAGAISDLLQAAQRSQRRVFTDPLTGVHNRGFFDRQLSVEVERGRRAGEPLALLFADLDHFKDINDRLGHQAGDRALQHLASLLVAHVRRIDAVFRYGGEEFALLLPGTDVQEAFNTAERLRRTLHASPPLLPAAGNLPLTISIGGAVFPQHAQSERDLLRHADEAMYLAKARGRDCVVMYPGADA
jgi:diguanylate cyclase (GGDEF)-like protein